MGLREVADELYGKPAGDFTASRNAAASGADKSLAKEIKALRKPSAAAAAINALVREHPEVIDAILEVGDRMREAFAARDRDEIRAATAERQRLLQSASRHVEGASASVVREIEETLQAAVIDPAAAAAVHSGMLVRGLESTGVDQVDVTDAVALPIDPDALQRSAPARADRAAAATKQKESAESASDRRERERRIRSAEKALEHARAAADTLDDELDEEVDRRSDLEAERDDLARRLERTQDELTESRAAERELRRRITQAHAAVREAEKALRATQ
ncbi:hypothetical protein [Leifsonia poae]|uniref:Uncharacterized protein n=1 Tax=Leifsonia poae TaxID=110933 RepID=A0A9W6HBB2_9MICO|nr:hypothetical protein [Leifsonia poae]GLJ76923.1 hypothetical protein GCM10017584_24970 [Leifsonia poae]